MPVAGSDVANSFAKHFSEKFKLNVSNARVVLNGVYNMQPENLIILLCSKLILIEFKSCKKSNNSIKGHEPKLYEALGVIAGLFFNFAYIKMKGPNKNSLTVNR